MRFLTVWMVCLIVVMAGCRPANPPRAPGAGLSSSSLKARLEAALAITYSGDRDTALAAVARDAARAAEADVTKAALQRITFTGAKDAAAADCAVLLANAGQGAAANEVAKMITFTGTRDEALKKLATGRR